MQPEWQSWCRLCGKTDVQNNVVKIGAIPNLIIVIKNHFSVTLTESECASNVCGACHKFIAKFEQFTERCTRVQLLFDNLLSSMNLNIDTNYLQALRYEAGLDEDEKDTIIDANKSIDTRDLTIVDVSSVLNVKNEPEKQSGRETRTKTRKHREKASCKIIGDEIKEEEKEREIDTFHYDNDDFENDPSFAITAEMENRQLLDDESIQSDDLEDDKNDKEFEAYEVKNKLQKRRRKTAEPENKTFSCPHCNIDFKSKKCFNGHMRFNHPKPKKMFVCSKCSKQFPSMAKLKIHESAIMHLPDELKYLHPCELCDKRFSNLSGLQAHNRAIHTGDRPFICEECGKSSVSIAALKEHQIIHSNEHPFQCQHCPKKFKNMHRLKIHEDTHKHTTYTCPHCDLQLNTKRTLRMHMVVHSDQKKYKCQYCGNEYKRSKALKNHLILHTGLRPYVCPFCEKTFASGANCRTHKKKSHPVELAALEASGEVLPTTNIPKLEHLQPKLKVDG